MKRRQREETSYLNPAPMSDKDARQIYSPEPERDARELALAKAALRSLRNASKPKA